MSLHHLALAILFSSSAALASAATPASGPRAPTASPPASACAPLAKPRSGPPPFPAGERLDYEVDVMGVNAGAMQFKVLPRSGRGPEAQIPIRVTAESNTFFTKVRKVKAKLVSNLRARDLRPRAFREDLVEGQQTRVANVTFPSGGGKTVDIEWRGNSGGGRTKKEANAEPLDYAGAIFLFRALPLTVGQPLCFEVYAMKRMWRVEGKVEAREQVSVPAGEFEALHLSATATRLGPGKKLEREVHIWLSDDERRLPLAAVGVIDLGPVRAVLARVDRPDFKSAPPRAGSMEW